MTIENEPLRNLRIATPCNVGWELMTGDERVRFCDLCKLHVYNFAEMTSNEIRSLLIAKEGHVCGRIYQRTDGTIITRDCPVGLKALRKRVAGFATTVFATLISAFSVAFSQTSRQRPVLNGRSSVIKLEQTPNDDQKPLFKGVVKDINGAVILNAEIVLVNSATKQKRTAFSANEGTFVFEDIVQGMYELNIKAQGFKTLHRPFLFLGQGEDTTAEITLAVGEPEGLRYLTGFVASSVPQYDNGEPIRLVPATRKHD